MRHPALARTLLAVAFAALAGSGCDQLFSELQDQLPPQGGASDGKAGSAGGTGAAGSSGSSLSCVGEMGPTGICKRCYDATGVLVHEDCPPPPAPPPDGGTPLPPKCGETTGASGQICKTCWDPLTGLVISNDCAPGSAGDAGAASPPGTACVEIDDGGPTSCKDPATWKQYGLQACAQKNLTLTDVKVVTPCAGGDSVVTYVCCGSGT
jgi:hypothetical protein